MELYIRLARSKECPEFGRPFACVIDGRLAYGFDSWDYSVRDFADGTTLAPRKRDSELTYALSAGQELTVSNAGRGGLFNGRSIEERWPTPLSRVLVCGALVFRVHPHDDTLFLASDTTSVDLTAVIIGFHAFMGYPEL